MGLTERSWSTGWRGFTSPFLYIKGRLHEGKVLSVFIDESGDFGQYNPASPNYYVTMVLHNQETDISKNIEALERQVSNWGYQAHTINQGDCAEKTKLAYTDKLTKEIANQLRAKETYFSAFDKIIVYNRL